MIKLNAKHRLKIFRESTLHVFSKLLKDIVRPISDSYNFKTSLITACGNLNYDEYGKDDKKHTSFSL